VVLLEKISEEAGPVELTAVAQLASVLDALRLASRLLRISRLSKRQLLCLLQTVWRFLIRLLSGRLGLSKLMLEVGHSCVRQRHVVVGGLLLFKCR